MGSTVKVAISLPKEEFEQVEGLRRRLGKSRSAVVAEAIRFWLEAERNEWDMRRYVAGYRKRPERAEETEIAGVLAESVLLAQDREK